MGIESLIHAVALTPANLNQDNKQHLNVNSQQRGDSFSQQFKTEVKRLHKSDVAEAKKALSSAPAKSEQNKVKTAEASADSDATKAAEHRNLDSVDTSEVQQQLKLDADAGKASAPMLLPEDMTQAIIDTQPTAPIADLSLKPLVPEATHGANTSPSAMQSKTADFASGQLDSAEKPTTPQPELITTTNESTLAVMPLLAEDQQEMSAMSGKVLPNNKKSLKDLNLDETLQALAAVMAKIPEPHTPNPASELPPEGANSAGILAQEQATLSADPNQLSPEMMALLSGGQASAQADPAKVAASSQPTTEAKSNPNPEINLQLKPSQVPEQDKPIVQSLPILQMSKTTDLGLSQNPLTLPDEGRFKEALNALMEGQNNVTTSVSGEKNLAGLGAEMLPQERSLNQATKVDIPPMTAHVYSSEWSKELSSKILWMTSQNISKAELSLNPEHLGPISIQINMQQDQASINFSAHNASVKDMLEASLPKLREMLQSQQLNLADVNVSQQSLSEQGQRQAQNPYFGQGGESQKQTPFDLQAELERNAPINEMANQIEQSRTLVTNGLVSLYA